MRLSATTDQISHTLAYRGLLLRALQVKLEDCPEQAANALLDLFRLCTLKDYVKIGSTFFWRQVELSLSSDVKSFSNRDLQLLTLLCADSYARFHPSLSFEFDVFNSDADMPVFFLPGTGQHITLDHKGARFLASNQRIQCISNLKCSSQPLPPSHRVVQGTFTVLSHRAEHLFDSSYLQEICSDNIGLDAFCGDLDSALSLIKETNDEFFNWLANTISFYVLIESEQPDTHRSFTCPRLHGLSFLSRCDSPVRLADAIIHEASHNELNIALLGNRVDFEPDNYLYYSPWRPDARPLLGLMHALYVFSNVLRFLTSLPASSMTPAITDYVKARKLLLYFRLKIALKQASLAKLNDIGAGILVHVNESLKMIEHDAANLRCPEMVLRHMDHWKAAYLSNPNVRFANPIT
jgi:hypothetical protein